MDTQEKQLALVIDDDDVFRERLCRALNLRGWDTREAGGADQAIAIARNSAPDLAVVDLRLPGPSGLEIVRALRGVDATLSIIMLTGYGSIATALEAVKCGANHYLMKPVDVDQLLSAYECLRNGPDVSPPAAVPSLARVEWEHIQRVLADCGGNVSQAAKLLAMHRRTLQRKLNKYPPRE
ncbi:MAG: response regulator [Bryobacteraceae bacterium]|nr:response regulator [Bryobacteraceae bacterium]